MSLIIYFGPYDKFGVIRHKTQGLRGVIKTLTSLGYDIELVPTRFLNRVVIYMMEHEIFRCNIKNLQFNIDYEEDELAQSVVRAVERAHEIFYSELNLPKFLLKRQTIELTDQIHSTIIFEIGSKKEVNNE